MILFRPGDEEADPKFYGDLAVALGVTGGGKNWAKFFMRIDISCKNDVLRVYVDEKLLFTELEDRFPSPENVAKLLLVLL